MYTNSNIIWSRLTLIELVGHNSSFAAPETAAEQTSVPATLTVAAAPSPAMAVAKVFVVVLSVVAFAFQLASLSVAVFSAIVLAT